MGGLITMKYIFPQHKLKAEELSQREGGRLLLVGLP